jgi:cell division protein FtsB
VSTVERLETERGTRHAHATQALGAAGALAQRVKPHPAYRQAGGIVLKCNPAAEQRGIISNGVKLEASFSVEMGKRRILLLVLLLFLTVIFLAFFGEKGILYLLRQQKELARIREMNMKLEEENQKLREEVRRLHHEKGYIEEVARKELGLVKEGEIIYQFDLPNDKKQNSKNK